MSYPIRYGVGVGEFVGVDAGVLVTTIVIAFAVKLAAVGSQALCEVTRTRWPTASELILHELFGLCTPTGYEGDRKGLHPTSSPLPPLL